MWLTGTLATEIPLDREPAEAEPTDLFACGIRSHIQAKHHFNCYVRLLMHVDGAVRLWNSSLVSC